MNGVVIKEIGWAFRQFFTWRFPLFSLLHSCSVIGTAVLRLCMGRSLNYSFSHTGEDRILESLISPQISSEGYYVEVGSNHPKFLSNTYSLYRKGWRGICIDANPKFKLLHEKYRPRDESITALVALEEKVLDFYLVENDVLSTLNPVVAAQYSHGGLKVRSVPLEAQSLTAILDKAKAPKAFELLSIDAEEHDLEVLKCLDWDKYQPTWVVVEDESWDWSKFEENETVAFMQAKKYRLIGGILKNLYFKKH